MVKYSGRVGTFCQSIATMYTTLEKTQDVTEMHTKDYIYMVEITLQEQSKFCNFVVFIHMKKKRQISLI